MAWPLVPLGEVLVERKERIGSIDADGLPLLGVSNKAGLHRSAMPRISDMSRYLRVEREWFAYNPMRVNVGSIGWAHSGDLAGVISPDYVVFSCTPKVHPSLLYWFLTSEPGLRAINLQTAGSVRERLYFASLARVTMPLPPIEEQRSLAKAIANLVDKVKQVLRLHESARQESAALWLSVLSSTFKPDQPCDESPENLFREMQKAYRGCERKKFNTAHSWCPKFCEHGPYALPTGWRWTTLGSVLSHLVDCVNDTPEFSESPTDFIGLKSTNVHPYRLDVARKWFVSQEAFDHWNWREQPAPGDIVLTREAPMGNACELPEALNVCLTQRLMLLRCDERFVSRRYVLHYLNSPLFKDQVLKLCRGLTTPHIRVGDLPEFYIPICARNVQAETVARLDRLRLKIEEVTEEQNMSGREIAYLLPSVLDHAFNGGSFS